MRLYLLLSLRIIKVNQASHTKYITGRVFFVTPLGRNSRVKPRKSEPDLRIRSEITLQFSGIQGESKALQSLFNRNIAH